MKLTFDKIGIMLGISRQRVHYLYKHGKIKVEDRNGKKFVVWNRTVTKTKRHVYTVDKEKE